MVQINSHDSETISAIRFILIVCVIYIHILPGAFEPISSDFSALNAFHFVSEGFSHNFCRIAVPAFFLLSGFFFFFGIDAAQNKLQFFIMQWKKRLRSLLIPYLIWNLLYVVLIVVKNKLFLQFGLQSDDFYAQIKTMGAYWIFWEMPIDFPLWYVRDLMCMVLLAPFFYLMIKHTGFWGILVLALLYFTALETGIPGFSTTAVFFFGVGAFLGCRNENLFAIPSRFGRIAFWSSLPLLVVSCVLNGTVYQEYLLRLFCPLGIVAMFDMVHRMPDSIIRRLSGLSATVFFVFATHQIYIMNWTKGAFNKILGTSVFSQWITYLLAPIVVLIVCMASYYLLKHIAPRCLAFSIGNRKY